MDCQVSNFTWHLFFYRNKECYEHELAQAIYKVLVTMPQLAHLKLNFIVEAYTSILKFQKLFIGQYAWVKAKNLNLQLSLTQAYWFLGD